MPPARDLLQRFVDSFERAIESEMEAMRLRQGPFEVPLGRGTRVDGEDGTVTRDYRFPVLQPNDKLVAQSECTLRVGASETLVTILEVAVEAVVVRSACDLDLSAASFTLVIYPWFLYERLKGALNGLVEEEGYFVDNALATFGQAPARVVKSPGLAGPAGAPPRLDAAAILNSSQQRAVELCCRQTPAFVWGPPGTGKTTTLGHIVGALLDRGLRVLVTSTTNAAVDQALTHLVKVASCAAAVERGLVLRLGQTQDETCGTGLHEVVERLNTRTRDALAALVRRRRRHADQADRCDRLLEQLGQARAPQQLGFFEEVAAPAVNQRELASLFSPPHLRAVRALDTRGQTAAIARRRDRLRAAARASAVRAAVLNGELRASEAAVVRGARVVLATMTNVYLSAHMDGERFDAVVVEEAGMAILPTLFYCACLARDRVILVGDPQQLPPIVQSPEPYVHRAMGRSIFAVTAPDPHASELVVMLDTQYRMHPAIGGLVSDLFYDGRLRHSASTATTQAIAAHSPYPGHALVLVDTEGRTTCATRSGAYSRFNEQTARRCVDLAVEAVRDGIECVAVITAYVEQSRLIRSLLPGDRDLAGRIECRTVHRFQGGERDMVILDTVDTEPMAPGVLLAGSRAGSSAANLINVSVSRARGKLVVVADHQYFRRRVAGQVITRVLDGVAASGLRAALSPGRP